MLGFPRSSSLRDSARLVALWDSLTGHRLVTGHYDIERIGTSSLSLLSVSSSCSVSSSPLFFFSTASSPQPLPPRRPVRGGSFTPHRCSSLCYQVDFNVSFIIGRGRPAARATRRSDDLIPKSTVSRDTELSCLHFVTRILLIRDFPDD